MTTAPPRGLGLAQASALYIAAVLGTGILALPGLAAAAAGPASILAVVAVLILSVPLAGSFAVLASRFPDSGGVATYVRLALGDTAARIAGYLFYFGVIIGAPAIGIVAGRYFSAMLGGGQATAIVVALVVLALPFLFNLGGLRVSGPVQLVLTALLVVVVLLVVGLAIPAADPGNLEPFLPQGWAGVGVAVSLMMWAVSGWEAVTHLAGEFRNPHRTIPLATAIAIVFVGAGYLALQAATIAVLGAEAGESEVPLLALVGRTAPGVGPLIVAGIALIVCLGVLNTYGGAFAKLGASLGRDGDLPRALAVGAERGGVPRRSLLVVAVVQAVYLGVAALNGFQLEPLILVHTACMVAIYALGMVAALRLLERFSLGWWFSAISLVLIAGMLVLAGPSLIVAAGLALVAVIVGLIKRRTRTHA